LPRLRNAARKTIKLGFGRVVIVTPSKAGALKNEINISAPYPGTATDTICRFMTTIFSAGANAAIRMVHALLEEVAKQQSSPDRFRNGPAANSAMRRRPAHRRPDADAEANSQSPADGGFTAAARSTNR
jgi:hypothetical protein